MADFDLNDFTDDVTTEEDYRHQKDALLYVIEVSESMIAGPSPQDSIFYRALDAACQSVRERIFESVSDMTGIMLYWTEKTTSQRYPHIYNIMDLGQPTAKDVKHVLSVLRDPKLLVEECQPFVSKIDENSASLANVFHCASEHFLQRSPRFTSRRLLLITNNDDPHAGDENQRNFARTSAKDLVDLGIRIVPTFVTSKEHPFDVFKFWDSVNYEPNVEYEEELRTVVADQLDIKKAVLAKHVLRRTAYNLTIQLGEDIKIGTRGFLMQKKPKVTQNRKLYTKGESSVYTTQRSFLINETSGKELQKNEVRHGYRIGQEGLISFDEYEIDYIKKFEDEPLIRILGFKPFSAIEPWMALIHPYFFYPADDRYVHSRRAFACLYKVLLEKKQVAIAWCVIQRRAAPRLAALFPCSEDIGQPGFQLVFLPFKEETREYPNHDEPIYNAAEIDGTTEEAIQTARKLHDAIKIPGGYNASDYPNARLQSFYNHLEALALDEDEVEEPPEVNIPYEDLEKKGGELTKELKQQAINYVKSRNINAV